MRSCASSIVDPGMVASAQWCAAEASSTRTTTNLQPFEHAVARSDVYGADFSLAQWRARIGSRPMAGRTARPAVEQPGPQLVAGAALPSTCLALVRRLRHLSAAGRVELEMLHGSLSGAMVLVAQPFSADGRELPKSVLKSPQAASCVLAASPRRRLHQAVLCSA